MKFFLDLFIPMMVMVFVFEAVMIESSLYDHNAKNTISQNGKEFKENKSHSAHTVVKDSLDTSDLPIILWWTNLVIHHPNDGTLHRIVCKEWECISTFDRGQIHDKRTRGIMFYGTDIMPHDLPLPRLAHHEWALFHEESPLNNYILSHQSFIHLFNHTATFRRDSDFPLTLHFIPDDDYLTKRKPIPLTQKNKQKVEKNFAPVVYIQSHCAVPSDRDRYVRELMKFVDIDSYGKCLKNRDIPPEFEDPASNLVNEKFLDFIAPYKFHLAFENAFCEDYITEKLYRTLHLGSIPVYKGSPSVLDWMPNNQSIILVDDFESPEKLAEFIRKVDQDDKLYESYLEYKTTGITNPVLKQNIEEREWRVNVPGYPDMMSSFECHVCQKISTRIEAERQGNEIPPKFANRSHMGCQQPYTLLVDPSDVPAGDVWKEIDWIEMYWQAFDQAAIVKKMLQNNETDSKKFDSYMRELYKSRFTP